MYNPDKSGEWWLDWMYSNFPHYEKEQLRGKAVAIRFYRILTAIERDVKEAPAPE